LPKYASVLLPKDDGALVPGDPISVAAGWSVARLGDKRAAPLLSKLLSKGSPELKALAAIGLGLLHEKKSTAELSTLARSVEAGNVARAAAAFALGELGAKDAATTLLTLAQGTDTLPRQSALIALGRLTSDTAASVIADGVLSADPALRESAVLAALVLETHQYRAARDPLLVPDGPVEVRNIMARLTPSGYSAEERARALVSLAVPLRRAAVAAAKTTAERARALVDALLARDGKPAFAPFTDGIDSLPPDLRDRAEQAAESIAAAVVPAFIAFERPPAPDIRPRAIQFLATRREDEAQDAIVHALGDRDEAIQKLAVGSIGAVANRAVVVAIAALLDPSHSWPLRVRAADALGRVGPGASAAFPALAHAASADEYALVREAAMRSLERVNSGLAQSIFRERAEKDAEARLRALAKELASRDPSKR
jgi:HEAT repeat protein